MEVYLTKWMARYSRREGISRESLRNAIWRAEAGLIDADLDGGLVKQRVAREGKGRSGGYRTIIAYRRANRAVFLYGFAKSERENVTPDDLRLVRETGAIWLAAGEAQISRGVASGELERLAYGSEETEPHR
jgi:hypothetical protein